MSLPQTILYVEDAEDDLYLMRKAITKAGVPIDLRVVRDGDEAIRYLKGEGTYATRSEHPMPGLVLLDLNLPKRTGFEFLEWLRRQPHLKRLVAIVLTASSRQEDVDRAHEVGANAVLVKPASFGELVHMLEQFTTWLELTRRPRLS